MGSMSVLIGFLALYGGFAYNKKRHENEGLDGSGADSIIGTIIALSVVILLRLLPYQVSKTFLFIFAFICFYFSVYAFTHLR